MPWTNAGVIRVISRTEKGIDVEWWVDKFFETFKEEDISSPSISFGNGDWYLNVDEEHYRHPAYPKQRVRISLQGYLKEVEHFPFHYWLGVRLPDGGEEKIADEDGIDGMGRCTWLQFSDLKRREQVLAPTGTIKVLLRMKTEQEIEKPSKSPRSPTERKYNQTGMEDILILQQHFGNLLHSEEDHDVVFRVQSKEFGAHKIVLQARSPVFIKMLEEGSSVISVDDVNPDCFDEFLQYVYTGKIENISSTNVVGLRRASEKFGFPALREKCREGLEYLIYDLMASDDVKRKKWSMAYFTRHLEEIMGTVEWQQFLLGNPVKGNKLILKALERRRDN